MKTHINEKQLREQGVVVWCDYHFKVGDKAILAFVFKVKVSLISRINKDITLLHDLILLSTSVCLFSQ